MNGRLSRPLSRLALAASLLLAVPACDDAPPATATANDRLLVVDGIEITLADAQPWLDYLSSYAPEWGKKSRLRTVLDEHLLPLRLAERAFAAERAKLRERASALRSVATNVVELEQHAKLLHHLRKVYGRRQVDLPLSRFLFDPLQTGGVSEPLAVPGGFVVAGCFELKEAPVAIDDLADSLLVVFATHDAETWAEWLAAERQRVAGKVSYVHPDHREAMPEWLRLP